MPKYGVFSGPYFPVFRLNTEKYGPEKSPYLDTFHAVSSIEQFLSTFSQNLKETTCDVLLFMIIKLSFWQKWFCYIYIPTNLANVLRAALLKHSLLLHKISLLSLPLKLAFFKYQKDNNKGLRSSNFALFSNPCLTLHVTSMSHTSFRVNLHSIVVRAQWALCLQQVPYLKCKWL